MTDILERLADLRVQATKERSHYYVASVVDEATAEIERLRRKFAALEIVLTAERMR